MAKFKQGEWDELFKAMDLSHHMGIEAPCATFQKIFRGFPYLSDALGFLNDDSFEALTEDGWEDAPRLRAASRSFMDDIFNSLPTSGWGRYEEVTGKSFHSQDYFDDEEIETVCAELNDLAERYL